MFQEKVAIPTGGARGTERATAEVLAAGGARALDADSAVPLGRAGTPGEAAGMSS